MAATIQRPAKKKKHYSQLTSFTTLHSQPTPFITHHISTGPFRGTKEKQATKKLRIRKEGKNMTSPKVVLHGS
jgi:hypothetical protein